MAITKTGFTGGMPPSAKTSKKLAAWEGKIVYIDKNGKRKRINVKAP
jgi:hypothetical protein